jgi:hypothetical protein
MQIKHQSGDLSKLIFGNNHLWLEKLIDEDSLKTEIDGHQPITLKKHRLKAKRNSCVKVVFRTNLLKVKERKIRFRVMSWLFSKAGLIAKPRKVTIYKVIPKSEGNLDLS